MRPAELIVVVPVWPTDNTFEVRKAPNKLVEVAEVEVDRVMESKICAPVQVREDA